MPCKETSPAGLSLCAALALRALVAASSVARPQHVLELACKQGSVVFVKWLLENASVSLSAKSKVCGATRHTAMCAVRVCDAHCHCVVAHPHRRSKLCCHWRVRRGIWTW